MKPTRIPPLTLLACLCAAFLLTTGCKEPKEPDPQPCSDCPGCPDCPEPPDCSECPDCTGCPELPSPQEMIIGTWKLTNYEHETPHFKKIKSPPEPKDCEECYVLIFNEDGTFSGTSSTNKFTGEYTSNGYSILMRVNDRTNEMEYLDGRFYIGWLDIPLLIVITDNKLQLSQVLLTSIQWYLSYKRIEPIENPHPNPPPVETPKLAYVETILHGCVGDPYVSDYKKDSHNSKFPENPNDPDKLDISIENDSLRFVVGVNYRLCDLLYTECRIENDTIYISIFDEEGWDDDCHYDCGRRDCKDCYCYCHYAFEFAFRIKEYQNFAFEISLTYDGWFDALFKGDIETYLLTKQNNRL